MITIPLLFLFAVSLNAVSAALIFLILALVLFALAAFNVPSSRFSLGWAGAFCLTLAIALS
jgi:hypothetical protein